MSISYYDTIQDNKRYHCTIPTTYKACPMFKAMEK